MLFPSRDETAPWHCAYLASLAYAEMRLIITRLLWNFDLELDERSRGWVKDMKVYALWEKGPLYVKLKPVACG
jgi:aspirochlorine biosynthesis cytochrome P450 monooxygenase